MEHSSADPLHALLHPISLTFRARVERTSTNVLSTEVSTGMEKFLSEIITIWSGYKAN